MAFDAQNKGPDSLMASKVRGVRGPSMGRGHKGQKASVFRESKFGHQGSRRQMTRASKDMNPFNSHFDLVGSVLALDAIERGN